MNKYITISAIALVLTSSLIAQKRKTDWERDNLKGRIKSFTTSTYDVISENGEIKKGTKVGNRLDVYNSLGRQIELYEDYAGSESGMKMIYEFDSNGDRVKYTSYNPAGGRYYTVTYKYTNGKVSGTETVRPVGETESEIYLYNSKSQLIENRVFGHDRTLKQSTTFKYDVLGNQIEEVIADADGTPDSRYFRKFDSKGNIIESRKEAYGSNGEVSDRLSHLFRYRRNNWGDWVEFSSSEIHGKLKRKETYEYDYDEKHNWVKQTTFENGKPIKIKERSIEYFR